MHQISPKNINYQDVYQIMTQAKPVKLSKQSKQLVKSARAIIKKAVEEKKVVYGATTGFGAFKNTAINKEQVAKLQENLIVSHAVGVGNYFKPEVVRGVMFLIANYLSKGHSGVRPVVVETLVKMLNKNVMPLVPEKGSVGSSGDLAPSAHIALVLLAKGQAVYKNQTLPGKKALKMAGIKPLKLQAKEGLALINNTATMTANAVLAISEAEKLLNLANKASALSSEALRATTKAFDKDIHSLKPHPGQISTAKTLRSLLKGSQMIDNAKTQDQYSIRCVPQIHGAVKGCFEYAKKVVNTEINSVTDNPLVFKKSAGAKIISGGNFHGEPIAIAMDSLGLAVCELANTSDRRIASLLDPACNNGLPAFLTAQGGLNSGLMILQYTTAALVSENKVLAHPASVDSIPTSANIEDLVSMGTISARKANQILENIKRVLAIELIVACQAIDFRIKQGLKLALKTQKIYNQVRKKVPFFKKDSEYYPFIKKAINLVDQGKV